MVEWGAVDICVYSVADSGNAKHKFIFAQQNDFHLTTTRWGAPVTHTYILTPANTQTYTTFLHSAWNKIWIPMLSARACIGVLTEICAFVYYRQVSLWDDVKTEFALAHTQSARSELRELKRRHFINKCDLYGAACVYTSSSSRKWKRRICMHDVSKKPMKCSHNVQCTHYTSGWCTYAGMSNFTLSPVCHRSLLADTTEEKRIHTSRTSRLRLQTTTHYMSGIYCNCMPDKTFVYIEIMLCVYTFSCRSSPE